MKKLLILPLLFTLELFLENLLKAKTLLLFCNGSWCSQSPNAIMSLVNLGYPLEKLLWYRGGMQDWLIYDFTVSKKSIKDIK